MELAYNSPFDEFEKYEAAKAICDNATCHDLEEFEIPEREQAREAANFEIRSYILRTRKQKECYLIPSYTSIPYSFENVQFFPNSPFEALDDKLADMDKVKKLINHVRLEERIPYSREITDKLNYLFDAVNDDPEEDPISPESMKSFISFFKRTPNLKLPEIVLTPSNEIRAQWRVSNNRHFAVVFLPNEDVRFVLFKPNSKDPDKIDRMSGMTSVDSLFEIVQLHNVFEWAAL